MNLAKLQELEKDLNEKKAEAARWDAMGDWFGVKDGSDFATFVQGLTFKSLLKLANRHLQIVKDRCGKPLACSWHLDACEPQRAH